MEVNYKSDEKTMIRLGEVKQGQAVLVNGKGTTRLVTGMVLNDLGFQRRVVVELETGELHFLDTNTMVAPVEAVMTIKE